MVADEDNRISFTVTATGPGGTTTANGPVSNPVTKPHEVAPKLRPGFVLEVIEETQKGAAGHFDVGSTVLGSRGQWDRPIDMAEDIQWERCMNANPGTCQPIAGETKQTYKLAPADVGHGVRYVLTVQSKGVKGSGESKLSPRITAGPPSSPTKRP